MKNSEHDLRKLAELCAELEEHGTAWACLCKSSWEKEMRTDSGRKICASMLKQIDERRQRIWELEAENARFEQVAFGLRDDMHALTDVILGGCDASNT